MEEDLSWDNRRMHFTPPSVCLFIWLTLPQTAVGDFISLQLFRCQQTSIRMPLLYFIRPYGLTMFYCSYSLCYPRIRINYDGNGEDSFPLLPKQQGNVMTCGWIETEGNSLHLLYLSTSPPVGAPSIHSSQFHTVTCRQLWKEKNVKVAREQTFLKFDNWTDSLCFIV